jgi:putative tryptophan/tyrosine transport system substrate-binding protein
MNRRDVITLLGAGAAWPLVAQAEHPALPVIGLLGTESHEASTDGLRVFREALAEAGYVDGRNVTVEYHWPERSPEGLPALAADLARRATVIVATNTQAALAAKAATPTVPIVFQAGADPVELGLVASIKRPGGNLSGNAMLTNTFWSKRLQLLHELAPGAELVAFLSNASNRPLVQGEARHLQQAAEVLGLRLLLLDARDQIEIEGVFAIIAEQRADALLVSADPLFIRESDRIVTLAARHAVPAIYQYRESVRAGGLASYGTNLASQFRLLAAYTAQILKGTRPAELPLVQATRFDLAINLKTAKALGLEVSQDMLSIADEIIE